MFFFFFYNPFEVPIFNRFVLEKLIWYRKNMFDVSKANHLQKTIDSYRTVMTIYDDSDALRAAAADCSSLHAMSAKMASTISNENLPTRTSAASIYLTGDRRRQPAANGGANTALTGTQSTVRREGLSALPARLHPILIRGGTYEEALQSVAVTDTLMTRDARLAASMSHVPPAAAVEDFWDSRLKLSKVLKLSSSSAEVQPSSGTPHSYVSEVSEVILSVRATLRSIEKRIERIKEEASGIVYCDTKTAADALQDTCNAALCETEKELTDFALSCGLAMLVELHRMRTISEYSMALADMEEWLHSMTTIHHATDRPLDDFELFVIGDCINEERVWANSAENAMAPIDEFQNRLKIILDLRQSEQEHRTNKAQKLSDLDPGLLLHTSEKNRLSAATSRRFQMLQHLARRALRLHDSAKSTDHSAGQRAKAIKVSDYVLGWVGEITENNSTTKNRSTLQSAGNSAISGNRVPLFSASMISANQSGYSSSVITERGYARFITSGLANSVDVVSRVSTEEIADQLSRVLLAFKETGEGADVIARRNELTAITDYIRSALVNPTISATIDTEELKRILEDLKEWEEENPDGASAAGYVQIIDTLRASASKCGLSVLADYDSPEYSAALTTKTPMAGVAPDTENDSRAHSARPASSVTLLRQFTAQMKTKKAKRSEAPILDAIYNCCDVIEALQQLRVHVRAKGRSGASFAFIAERIEPLQRELDSILEELEGAGVAKEDGSAQGERNALVVEAQSGSDEKVVEQDNLLSAQTSKLAETTVDWDQHPLVLKLSVASEHAVGLLKEATALGVQVPASCWILTHSV